MKQMEINKTYGALSHLSQMQLPINIAYKVYSLIKKLDEPYKFAMEQEKKLIEKYKGEFKNDGSISFASIDDKVAFQKEFFELQNLEHDIDFEKIIIKTDDLGKQTITAADIFALEGFVAFE